MAPHLAVARNGAVLPGLLLWPLMTRECIRQSSLKPDISRFKPLAGIVFRPANKGPNELFTGCVWRCAERLRPCPGPGRNEIALDSTVTEAPICGIKVGRFPLFDGPALRQKSQDSVIGITGHRHPAIQENVKNDCDCSGGDSLFSHGLHEPLVTPTIISIP